IYSLITPNVLRVESEEKVVVEAHGHNQAIEFIVTVHDFPLKSLTLFQTRANLSPANGMIDTPLIKLPEELLPNDRTVEGKSAKAGGTVLEKVVLVSFHSGYIFIQTDKTIYTPGSTVLYRIFTVGHHLEALYKTVILEFEVRRALANGTVTTLRLLGRKLILPFFPSASLGTWKIVAKYEDSPQQTFNTQFDVKEYVLPSFEVILEPSEKFLYIDDNNDFRVSITASWVCLFLYGKKLDGTAFVIFGVKLDDEKKSIPQSLKRIQVTSLWDGEAVLSRASLQARFPNLNELIGHSLYIAVTVLTESGSDMVEAERTGIYIVTSPYQIHFTKTPKFFKPGMPFELMVYVTNPDGSPASNVPVRSEAPFVTAASTQAEGTAKLILNMPAQQSEVAITVKTARANLPPNRQATASMVARAYQTQGGSGNYLHLAVTATELKPGDNLPVNFNIKSNNAVVLNQIQYFTYIILNKGKLIRAERQLRQVGQNLVTMSLPITPELIPSFRIVAYYQVGNSEIVADSVWVDVKDTCIGTLVVKGATAADNRIHQPGTPIKIKLEGDHKSRVGLVAVDKGVYVLNKQYKITQTKIWDAVEKNDIGCTAGSGINNLGVFADAGLTLITSNKITTPQRSEPQCPQPARRKRQTIQLIEYKATAQYHDKHLKKCCEDGMHENPMGHSCEKRARYILETDECKKAFLDCCNHIKTIRDERQRDETLQLARSKNGDTHTLFPWSLLDWQEERELPLFSRLRRISSKTVPVFLKDSITTWEVLAVSISETKGICVADPYEITVMKDFFIDLRLPYSVVRNEQVEIRAILYNYASSNVKVRVSLTYNPAFCSASSSKEKYQQTLTITKESSVAVPLVLVPMEVGLHDVEVKAAVFGTFVSDGVKKKLKVVELGARSWILFTTSLSPFSDGVQEEKVRAADIDDIVPNTDSETKVTVQGNPVAQIVENSIDGANLKHLIITPSGCGEQNMITMTPSVIATYYLDNTGQWEAVGVDRRKVATDQIMKGYAQQMAYKKADFSYAAFQARPSSTWLTAYVAKVFALAIKLVPIEAQVLCGAVKWLILEKQKPDGIFQEDAPVVHQEMVGGYRGSEAEVSLTAFVLIALHESKDFCKDQVNSLESSITKAAEFLARRYDSLARPYTTALTSYALAMVGKLTTDRKLMALSKGGESWEERGARTYNIEGTSYALLALLKMKKFDQASPVVRWLTQQNYYGGTYGQTQATIMVFQALAQYQIEIPSFKDLHLDVSILLPKRFHPVTFTFVNENAMVAKSAETKHNEDLTVKAQGKGKGTLTVVTVYNAKLKEDESQCKKFHLEVSVGEPEGVLDSVKIKICARYLGETDATMSIIDVSMMTGYSPDVQDLRRLSEGVDRYISKFEINKAVSDRGNLVIYLDKVKTRAKTDFNDQSLSPLLSLDDRCTKFYHPSRVGGLLNKICHGDVCRCAEESCFIHHKSDDPIDVQKRLEEACEPGVDYGYLGFLPLSPCPFSPTPQTTFFLCLLPGSDENPGGKTRTFISHVKCRDSLKLELNKDYLIWGAPLSLPSTRYIIGKDTWVEKWPNDDECQEEQFQNLCQEFQEFSNDMTMNGCSQ
uniref:Complement C3 n=1 Tax=Sphenodon punctatus TaxID=8508 RepID=A0A8D0GR95_SPHPU